MRDDDRLLNLPDLEFGSGVIGVCDICGSRQAVVVLSKERYKLCVLDFLNKTWIKTDKKPGAPAPLYRSDRIWFDTGSVSSGRAQAIVLSPTKPIKHPVILVTPDVFGITTTLLDAAIRFARDGFEVLIPDVFKTDGIGPGHAVALRYGAQVRGGVTVESARIKQLLQLYIDALNALRGREMVDPGKAAVFGTSYGACLALGVAAQDTRLAAVVLAYPMPVRPPDLGKLVSAPLLYVGGTEDRSASKARAQLASSLSAGKTSFEFFDVPGARHNFLARDLSGYEVAPAEAAWTRIQTFLKRQLLPPPPKPPAIPTKPPTPAPPAATGSPPGSPAPLPAPAPKPVAPAGPVSASSTARIG